MSVICKFCGKELSETDVFCSGCGNKTEAALSAQVQQPKAAEAKKKQKQKIPGRGFGITSLVLGIIACYESVFMIVLALATGLDARSFGGIFVLAALPVIFGILARKRGYKKLSAAGLVLGIIACAILILFFVFVLIIAPLLYITIIK